MLELSLKRNKLSGLKNLSILTAMVCLLMSGGCRKETPIEAPDVEPEILQEEPFVYNSPFKKVEGPVKLAYLINNPNIEVYDEIEENDQYREMKLSISKLKDKNVEEIINSKISSLHQRLKEMELPPTRGIKKIIPDGSTLQSEYITTSMTFSYYNIISVNSVASRTYKTPDAKDYDNFVEYTDTITLDLKTGEEIILEDLFITDSNYKERLNELIRAYLNNEYAEDEYSEWYSSITLVAPFSGIKDTQKFMLTENALSLVIDYETPEFDTMNYYTRINIPYYDLQDILAIKERFYDSEDPIFDHEYDLSYTLIDYYHKRIKGERLNEKINGVQVYYESRYPNDLPLSIEEDFEVCRELVMKEIDRLSEIKNLNGYYFQESIASLIGDYIIFYTSKNIIDGNDNNVFTSEFRTYRMNGEILNLDDLFIEEYNYDEIIRTKLIESFPDGYEPDSSVINQLLQSLTFRINRTSIYFASMP
ncbi:MAG TPA: DUF3298 domain-containing protein, partial [Proteiniclasticum sp.]|nr:DUF3298 domain-containing protein [Proteiniclasticum sp.]